MTQIVPTIGRKIYFDPGIDPSTHKFDPNQAVDATVIFIQPGKDKEGRYLLSLFTVDHTGTIGIKPNVPLVQAPFNPPVAEGQAFAYWMDYQVGQASGAEAEKEPEAQAQTPQNVAESEPEFAAAIPELNAGKSDEQPEPARASGDFGYALSFLKTGHKLARSGWNGRGMFVFLVQGSTFKVNRAPLLGIFPEGTEINYNPHIDIKGADGSISTWVPSIGDVMANDWQIVD